MTTWRWPPVAAFTSSTTRVIVAAASGVPKRTPQSMSTWIGPCEPRNVRRKQSPSPSRYIRTFTAGAAWLPGTARPRVAVEEREGLFVFFFVIERYSCEIRRAKRRGEPLEPVPALTREALFVGDRLLYAIAKVQG